MRLNDQDIVKEGHDIKELALSFTNKDDDVTESERVLEKECHIVFERLQKSTGKILLVPSKCPFLPILVVSGRNVVQGGDPHSLFLL